MDRRELLTVAGLSTLGALSGCLDDGEHTDEETADQRSNDEENTDQDDSERRTDVTYDFSSCEYELNNEKIEADSLATSSNDPQESDLIRVEIAYTDTMTPAEHERLRQMVGAPSGEATHEEESNSYVVTEADPLDKCVVAELSHKEYVAYIRPLPRDDP